MHVPNTAVTPLFGSGMLGYHPNANRAGGLSRQDGGNLSVHDTPLYCPVLPPPSVIDVQKAYGTKYGAMGCGKRCAETEQMRKYVENNEKHDGMCEK